MFQYEREPYIVQATETANFAIKQQMETVVLMGFCDTLQLGPLRNGPEND